MCDYLFTDDAKTFFFRYFDEVTLWWCSFFLFILFSISSSHYTDYSLGKQHFQSVRGTIQSAAECQKSTTTMHFFCLLHLFIFFFNFMNVFNFYVLTVWCDWYNRRVKWSMWQRQCSRCTRSMLLRTTVSWWWTCAVETTVRSSGTLHWKTSAESQGRRWTR